MREKVMFVIDAAGDLSLEQIKDKPIMIVPARVHIEGREELFDLFGISPQEYWEVLKTCQTPPSTSMAPPLEWMAAYKRAYEQGYTHLFVTTVSSTGSGVFGAACMGVGMLREEGGDGPVIETVDSLGYSAIYGHAILRGCEMAAEGVPFAEIVQNIRDIFNRTEAVIGVYTLKYLKRSGRINGVAAFAGEALGLRPILRARGGSIEPCDKVRGDNKVVPAIINNMARYFNRNDSEQRVNIVCGDVPEEDILELERLLRERFGVENPTRYIIGPSIATNTGPHCIGTIYYGEPRGVE